MKADPAEAPFAFSGLDRIFHERARLGIVTSLVSQPEGASFVQLRRFCGLTDGNLNRHLTVLAEAGYVAIRKDAGEGRGATVCVLTELGRGLFIEYLGQLERVLREAKPAAVAGRKLTPRSA